MLTAELPPLNVGVPIFGVTSGPSCSKHFSVNWLIKRSTHLVFYNFITKYTDIFF